MAPGTVITDTDLDLPTAVTDPVDAAPVHPTPLPVGEPIAAPAAAEAHWPSFNEAKRAVVDAFEREYLGRLLRAHRGNVSRAAQSARKERRDFGRLLRSTSSIRARSDVRASRTHPCGKHPPRIGARTPHPSRISPANRTLTS